MILLPGPVSAALLREQYLHRTAFAMGTTVSIQAYGSDRQHTMNTISKAFETLYRFDRLFSLYDRSSTISRINSSAGDAAIPVENEVMDLLRHAIIFTENTNGAFDCTIEPLMRLWGFRDPQRSSLPSDREIAQTLNLIGYQNVLLDLKNQTIGLNRRGCSLDLGGIAVGYTVDAMAAILRNEGITSALINHSGDVYALGAPPEKDGWDIGITSPAKTDELIRTLQLKDKALSTSGSYEKFITINNTRYGHILDRESGIPADNIFSSTVISDSSISSDAFSTAIFSSQNQHFNSDNFGTKLEIHIIDKQMNYIQRKQP